MGKVKRDLRKVLGYTQNMKEMGLVPTTKVLSKKTVKATLENNVAIECEESLYRSDKYDLAFEVSVQ